MNHKQPQIQVHGGKEAHPPSDAREFQESLLRFKRRTYLATVLLGFVVCLLCLGFLEWSGNTQLRLRLILMLALSFEVIVAAILLRSVRWIPVAESLLVVL